MCRLALIDVIRIELVIRTNRDVDLFFRIPVVIPEVKRVGPIRIHFPAVECRTHILPTRVFDLILAKQAGDQQDKKTERHDPDKDTFFGVAAVVEAVNESTHLPI